MRISQTPTRHRIVVQEVTLSRFGYKSSIECLARFLTPCIFLLRSHFSAAPTPRSADASSVDGKPAHCVGCPDDGRRTRCDTHRRSSSDDRRQTERVVWRAGQGETRDETSSTNEAPRAAKRGDFGRGPRCEKQNNNRRYTRSVPNSTGARNMRALSLRRILLVVRRRRRSPAAEGTVHLDPEGYAFVA